MQFEQPAVTLNPFEITSTLSLPMGEFQAGRANGMERLTEETFEKSFCMYFSGMKAQLPCCDDNALYGFHLFWKSKAIEFYRSNSNIDIENLLVNEFLMIHLFNASRKEFDD